MKTWLALNSYNRKQPKQFHKCTKSHNQLHKGEANREGDKCVDELHFCTIMHNGVRLSWGWSSNGRENASQDFSYHNEKSDILAPDKEKRLLLLVVVEILKQGSVKMDE
jgi:hypothetical protein